MRHARAVAFVCISGLVSALALVSCGGGGTSGSPSSPPGDDGGVLYEGGGACMADVESHPIEGADHVATCSAVTYGTNPPSSGNHYPVWAAYRTYTVPVPHGFSVHNLEHGAIVVSYNCPDGCADQLARIAAWQSTVSDPDCSGSPIVRRLAVTPDPSLGAAFAAASWGFTMSASCFDEDAFSRFFADHIGRGREIICSDGEDVESLQGGVAGCGNSP